MTLFARLTLAALCIACWLTPASQAQVPKILPRIAIIAASEDRDVASLADLLTAAMSQASHDYELIERAELNRIAQEAGVQAMGAAERPRALARLARADGLILLSMEPSEKGHRSISARLSSTGSGLILQTFMLAAEARELPTAANLAADALRFAAGRIGKAGSAVPHIVSLLGIRADTGSSPGVAMETPLNTAITHHLSGTAGFGVVERWKLDDVAFERSLSEKDMPAFATGTVLVDGSLEIKDKAAIAKVRIRKSRADPGRILPVEGSADAVPALARAIAVKIAAESGSTATPAPWDSSAEAAAYAKLGHWLLAQAMSREAAQAYETAVALGDRNPETLFKRIYAYSTVSDPKNPKTARNAPLHESSDFSRWHWQLVDSPDFFPTFLHSYNRALTYANELIARDWQPFPGSIWKDGHVFAGRVASQGCQILLAAHRLQMHLKHPAEVASLRSLTESLATYHLKKPGSVKDHNLIFFAGYWTATPEQAISIWLDFLAPKPKFLMPDWQISISKIIKEFGNPYFFRMEDRTAGWPLIVDWSSAGNERGDAAWKRLLQTLRGSKSLVSQSDGFALEIYTTKDPVECERIVTAYLNILERNIDLLNTLPEQAALFLYDPKLRPFPKSPEFARRFAAIFERMFENAERIEPMAFPRILVHLNYYLAPSRENIRLLPRDDAARLHSAIQRYAARVAASGRSVDGFVFPYTVLTDLTGTIRHAYPDADVGPSTSTLASVKKNVTDGIHVKFISVAREGAPTDRNFWMGGYSTAVCGDNILVERLRSSGGGFIEIGRDLAKREIPAPPRSILNGFADNIRVLNPRLYPSRDGFYANSTGGTLLHYSHATKAWTDSTALLGGQRLTTAGMLNNTFYTATFEGGYMFGRFQDGQFELIASSRRRPAEHPLDELAGVRSVDVFAGAFGRPCGLLGLSNHSEVYDLELRKNICSLSVAGKVSVSGKVPIIEDLSVVAAIDPQTGVPRTLIRRPYPKIRNTEMLDDDLPRETVWDWPKDMPVDFIQRVNYVSIGNAVHGDHLFLLKCAHSMDFLALDKATQPSVDKLSLLCYRPGHREALEVPLVFDTDVLAPFGLVGDASSPAPLQPEFGVSHLNATSAGLFFTFSDRWLRESDNSSRKPGLLHVAWKDVNDWLTRHGHASIRTDAAPGAITQSR